MSGVAIIQNLLANNIALLAQVPAARINAGVVPLATALPAVAVQEVSSVERTPVAMAGGTVFVTERIQVTVLAKTYALQKTLLGLVRAACPVSRGTVAGFACESVLPAPRGPDMFDAGDGIYMQTQDFIVSFNR